ncbi:MAG: 3'-5' exonuclease [Oscillospiraceae bacterium]|nr:3'-5' exonuclease [Oscillospiraceae bacterium]
MARIKEMFVDDYIVCDIETTGLSAEYDHIIEIAALKVNNGTVTETFSTLVKPPVHISREITALTGINDDMVSDAPDISSAIKDYVAFIGELPLLGHNFNRFDRRFLQKQAEIKNTCLDTLEIARHIRNNASGCSLSALCTSFGIVNDNAHRAVSDCIATDQVYKKLRELYSENGGYIEMAVTCTRTEYQKNISSYCPPNTALDYEMDKDGNIIFFADRYPIGILSGLKKQVFYEYLSDITGVMASRVEVNAKGKYLLGVEISVK